MLYGGEIAMNEHKCKPGFGNFLRVCFFKGENNRIFKCKTCSADILFEEEWKKRIRKREWISVFVFPVTLLVMRLLGIFISINILLIIAIPLLIDIILKLILYWIFFKKAVFEGRCGHQSKSDNNTETHRKPEI